MPYGPGADEFLGKAATTSHHPQKTKPQSLRQSESLHDLRDIY